VSALLDVVTRAAWLLLLAIAPPLVSPEPAPAANAIAAATVAVVFFAAVLYGALALRSWGGSTLARVAAALIWVAVAAALGTAFYFQGARAPLGRGVLFVAVPIWAALAMTAVWVAERRLGKGPRVKPIAVAATVAAGAILFALASAWLTSPTKMWWEALRRDAEHPRAIVELTRSAVQARDYTTARAITDKCLELHPASCRCKAERIEIAIRSRAFVEALEQAFMASSLCRGDAYVHALYAETLGLNGRAAEAEDEALRGLGLGGPEGRLRYALALGLSGMGKDAEAVVEAKRALQLGAGRGPALLIAASALGRGDHNEATQVLTPIVAADPNDADAQYDLALAADRAGDYNRARSGYLAALRADPTFVNARYNLVILTHRRGVVEESRHHVRRFVEEFPGDKRGADLARLVGLPP
jgi:tetratricopeptide (TPR) repeat protein